MNTYVAQFAATMADRFAIQTESSAEGMTVLCRDLAGNLVTSRTFTLKQLRNGPLVSLVLTDLRNMLLASKHHPAITPLPESLHPSAS